MEGENRRRKNEESRKKQTHSCFHVPVIVQVQIRNTDGRRRLLAWSEPEELSDIDVEQVERLGPYLRGSDDDCDGVGDRFYEEDMESYTDKSGHGVGSGGKESGWARGERDEGAEEDIGVTDSRTVGVKVGVGNKANGGLHVIGEELREEKSENEDGDVLSSPPEAAAAASGVDGFPGSSRFWTWVLSGDVDVRADDGKRQQMVGGGSRVRGGKTFLGDSSDGQEGNGDEWRRGELRDGGESGGRVSAVSKVDVGGRRKRRCSHHRRRGNEGGGISSKRWSPYHGVDSGGPGDNAMMMEMENDGGYGGGAEGGREGDFEAEMGSSTAELDPLEGENCTICKYIYIFSIPCCVSVFLCVLLVRRSCVSIWEEFFRSSLSPSSFLSSSSFSEIERFVDSRGRLHSHR